jgi:hypothetical protein
MLRDLTNATVVLSVAIMVFASLDWSSVEGWSLFCAASAV